MAVPFPARAAEAVACIRSSAAVAIGAVGLAVAAVQGIQVVDVAATVAQQRP